MSQPTMDDVAARAGVSRALVSLVMRDSPKVSDKSRVAVLDAAAELGYRPNLMARNLASRRTKVLGVVLNDLHNPFFAEVSDGIHEAAGEAGYQLVINSGLRSVEGEARAIDTLLQFRADGLIIAGARSSAERLEELGGTNNIVVVGRELESDRVDTIINDDLLGARIAIDHLVELGHRRIAHIDGGVGAGANARREGYVAAMRAHGLQAQVRIIPGAFTEQAGTDGVERLLRDLGRPTAIFAANDLMATGALDRLEDEGLRVPGDVSLIGYDNTSIAALHHIGLSTINQPTRLMGRLATRCLVERLDGGRTDVTHHVLEPSLVARATTGAAPTA